MSQLKPRTKIAIIITIAVASVLGGGGVAFAYWTAVPGCSASDYTVGTPTTTYGPIAGGTSISGSVTVTMILGTNQDACQGAIVPLYFVAS